MKTLKLLVIAFISTTLFTLNSCEKVKDLTDVEFDATIKTDLDVTSGTGVKGDTVYTFEGEATFDPTEDEMINEYWNVIKEWRIKKIIISVKNIDKETLLTEASVVINDVDNNNEVLFHRQVQEMKLKKDKIILSVEEAEWNSLSNALNNKDKIYAHIEGGVDNPNVNIVFGVEIQVHVVANPL